MISFWIVWALPITYLQVNPNFDFNCIFIFYFIHQIRDKADENANIDDAKGHHFNDEFP